MKNARREDWIATLEKVHAQISQELNFVIKQWNKELKKLVGEWKCDVADGSELFDYPVCFTLGEAYQEKTKKEGRVSRTIYDEDMELVPF